MNFDLLIYGKLETVSGGYRYDRELASALSNQGMSVEVVTVPRSPYLFSIARGLLWAVTRDSRPAVSIQDELCHPSLALPNALGINRPAVAIVHHLRTAEDVPAAARPIVRAVEYSYLRSVDGFIFNSHATQKSVERALRRPVPGVVAHPAWSGSPPPTGLDEISHRAGRDGPLRILFAGNLIPRKRLDSVIAALASLPRGRFRLRIAGDPAVDRSYTEQLKDQIRRWELEQYLEFLGPLSDTQLANEYREADVLAVPSQHEGFGRVYLEAHAYGLPVIGARSGGAAEIVSDGASGWLVDPQSPGRITEKLSQLADDPNLRFKMGRAALQQFRQHPTWEDNGPKIAAFLERVAALAPHDRSKSVPLAKRWKRRRSHE